MICHARVFVRDAATIFSLPVAMIFASGQALLVERVGAATLLAAGLLAAHRTAIAMAAVAVRADVEDCVAFTAAANPLQENCFAVTRRHALPQAGDWTTAPLSCQVRTIFEWW